MYKNYQERLEDIFNELEELLEELPLEYTYQRDCIGRISLLYEEIEDKVANLKEPVKYEDHSHIKGKAYEVYSISVYSDHLKFPKGVYAGSFETLEEANQAAASQLKQMEASRESLEDELSVQIRKPLPNGSYILERKLSL